MRKPRFWADRTPRTYAEQTYDSPYWLVRFPHRQRYDLAISTIAKLSPTAIVDYGAGDGYLVTQVLDDPRVGSNVRVIAYEPVDAVRTVLRATLRDYTTDRAIACGTEAELLPDSCDLLICLGVLEHLTLLERFRFYDLARRVLRGDGRCLIDVPIEIGPTVLIKNIGRRMLKGRGREYTWPETLAAAAGRIVFDPARYDPRNPTPYLIHHKGFDYRLFERELRRFFVIDEAIRSPLPMLPAGIANQEIFYLARVRPGEPE